MEILLFVYGSLQQGFSNDAVLAGARFLGTARTAAGHRLVSYVDGFPALYREQAGRGSEDSRAPQANDGWVQGELYELNAALLARLDDFEDVPQLYQREEIELESGKRAFAYVIAEAEAWKWPAIPSGIWRP